MNNFLFYAIQVIAGSALFFGFYKLFMEKETHFTLNRYYLLISLGFSFIIPLIQLPIHPVSQTITIREIFKTLQVVEVGTTGTEEFSIRTLMIIFYFSGVLFFLSRFIGGFIQLLIITRKANSYIKNGTHFKIIDREIAPFSFWKTIYINEKLKDSNELDTILLHESIHIKQFHTLDVLVFELATILFWFNPFFHIFKRNIKEQHEYIVDGIIKKSRTEIKSYLMLLCHTAGIRFNITNNFNKPLIIKRMRKMAQNPSKAAAHYKLLLTIPIIVGLVVLFSIQNSNAKSIILPTNNNNSIVISSDVVNDSIPKKDKKFRMVEKVAVFPGGNEQLPIFLGQNIKYPEESRKKGVTGTVIVEFTITTEGNIEDVKVVKGVAPELDNEAVRVIKLMPKWIPAEDKGEKVNMIYTLPIRFKLN